MCIIMYRAHNRISKHPLVRTVYSIKECTKERERERERERAHIIQSASQPWFRRNALRLRKGQVTNADGQNKALAIKRNRNLP